MSPAPCVARIDAPVDQQATSTGSVAQVAAMDRQTAAIREQSAELRKLRLTVRAGIQQVQPACTAVRGVCAWGRKWGPRLMWSAPGVLVAVGAVSPSAAAAFKAFLSTIGVPQ